MIDLCGVLLMSSSVYLESSRYLTYMGCQWFRLGTNNPYLGRCGLSSRHQHIRIQGKEWEYFIHQMDPLA